MDFFSCRVVVVNHVIHEILVEVLRAQLGFLLVFFSFKEDFVHLDEFGLLSQAKIHLGIRLVVNDNFVREGLFLLREVRGVLLCIGDLLA